MKKSGEEMDIALTWTPVRDGGEEAIGIVCTAQDITSRKQAQRMSTALMLKAKEVETLQKVDGLRKDLIATVSHELRGPLASIKGYISTLLQTDVEWEPERQREFLEKADQEAERLNRLVGELLTMSQLEAGVLRLRREVIHLVDLRDDMDTHLAPLVSRHRLEIGMPAHLPRVFADTDRLIQVISNLVGNAAKFYEPGSTITVGAETCEESHVVVSVHDEGKGINSDQLERVFDPF